MRSCQQCCNLPPRSGPLDLAVDSAATRSALYAQVAEIAFKRPGDAPAVPAPIDAALQARLVILFLFGEYFAAWALPDRKAAEPTPCRRLEMVRLQLDPAKPTGLMLSEI